MSRTLSLPESDTPVAQLIARTKRSSTPVEIPVQDSIPSPKYRKFQICATKLAQFFSVGEQIEDSDLVVAVLPRRDLDRIHALRQFDAKLVKKSRPKTPAQYLAETERKLRRYEKKYKMSSAEFYRKFQAAEIDEDEFDYFDWRVQYNAYKHLKKKIANGKRQTA